MTFQPVIIIGAPRSGTNMLRDVLTRMEGFYTWPCDEINFVWKHGNLSHQGDDLLPGQIKPQTRKFVGAQFHKMFQESSAPFIVEKTCANSVRVPFVDALVPNAKYVLLLRDGRDAVASILNRWQTPSSSLNYLWQKFKFVAPTDKPRVLWDALAKRIFPAGTKKEKSWSTWGPVFPELISALNKGRPLAEICSIQWAYCVKRSIESLTLLDQSRWLPVRYEDFVTNPSRELPRVLDFLEARYSAAQIALAIEDVHPGSIGNSGRSLAPVDLEIIDAVISEIEIDLDCVMRR